jgi:hypothetical protein
MNRWSLALHECAHAVAVHVLSGKPATATLHTSGGAAWPSAELSPTDRAIVAAAGPLAEHLADRHSPPALPVAVPTVLEPPVVETVATPATAKALKRRFKRAIPDHVQLARFCIAGIENQPQRWAQRHAWIQSVAERLIHNHEHTIVEVAKKLYVRGVVSVPLDERKSE